MKCFIKLAAFILLVLTVSMASCKKETVAPPGVITPLPQPEIKIFTDLNWELSLIDSGVSLKLPRLPDHYSIDSIKSVYLQIRKLFCISIPNGERICILPGGMEWKPVQRDGIDKGKIFYRVESNTVVLYAKSTTYDTYYQTAKESVLIKFR